MGSVYIHRLSTVKTKIVAARLGPKHVHLQNVGTLMGHPLRGQGKVAIEADF